MFFKRKVDIGYVQIWLWVCFSKEKLTLDITKYDFEYNHERKILDMIKYEFKYVYQMKNWL
jgi:hypothetical protein